MSTTTLTIGELSIKVQAAGLGGATVDTARATEFDVEVEYVIGELGACEVTAIKACSNVHFSGDISDCLVRHGVDILALFTGSQVDALTDRIMRGGSDE